MSPLICRRKKIATLFIISILTSAVFLFNGLLQAAEDEDQCVSCHTDMARMKKMIEKFPAPPEEEGEA